jgi:hypothetical protein
MPSRDEFDSEVEYLRYPALFAWIAGGAFLGATYGFRWLLRLMIDPPSWLDNTLLVGGWVLAGALFLSGLKWTLIWLYSTQWRDPLALGILIVVILIVGGVLLRFVLTIKKEEVGDFLQTPLGRGIVVVLGLGMAWWGVRTIRGGLAAVRGGIHLTDTDVFIRGGWATFIGRGDVIAGLLQIGLGIAIVIIALFFPERLRPAKPPEEKEATGLQVPQSRGRVGPIIRERIGVAAEGRGRVLPPPPRSPRSEARP